MAEAQNAFGLGASSQRERELADGTMTSLALDMPSSQHFDASARTIPGMTITSNSGMTITSANGMTQQEQQKRLLQNKGVANAERRISGLISPYEEDGAADQLGGLNISGVSLNTGNRTSNMGFLRSTT